MQNKVADVLLTLGVPFAEEYSPRANFFGIDIASEPCWQPPAALFCLLPWLALGPCHACCPVPACPCEAALPLPVALPSVACPPAAGPVLDLTGELMLQAPPWTACSCNVARWQRLRCGSINRAAGTCCLAPLQSKGRTA